VTALDRRAPNQIDREPLSHSATLCFRKRNHRPSTGVRPLLAALLGRSLRVEAKRRAAATAVRSGAVTRQDVELRISASSILRDSASGASSSSSALRMSASSASCIARQQKRTAASTSPACGPMMAIVCGPMVVKPGGNDAA